MEALMTFLKSLFPPFNFFSNLTSSETSPEAKGGILSGSTALLLYFITKNRLFLYMALLGGGLAAGSSTLNTVKAVPRTDSLPVAGFIPAPSPVAGSLIVPSPVVGAITPQVSEAWTQAASQPTYLTWSSQYGYGQATEQTLQAAGLWTD